MIVRQAFVEPGRRVYCGAFHAAIRFLDVLLYWGDVDALIKSQVHTRLGRLTATPKCR